MEVKPFCPLNNLFCGSCGRDLCYRPQPTGEESGVLMAPGRCGCHVGESAESPSLSLPYILCFEDDSCRISQSERTTCSFPPAPSSTAHRASSGTLSNARCGRRGLMGPSVPMPPSLGFRAVFLVKVHPFVYLARLSVIAR